MLATKRAARTFAMPLRVLTPRDCILLRCCISLALLMLSVTATSGQQPRQSQLRPTELQRPSPAQTPPGPYAPIDRDTGAPTSVDPATTPPAIEDSPLQTDQLQSSAMELSLPTIEQLANEATANEDLTADVKQRIAELYANAKANLQGASQFDARGQQNRSLIENIQQRVDQTNPQNIDRRQIPPGATATALEQLSSVLHTDLAKKKEEKLRLDEQATTRSARRSDVRRRLEAIEKALADTRQRITAPAVTGEPQQLTVAKQNAALSQLRVLLSERPALQGELELYDAEDSRNLLQTQRDFQAKQIDQWTADLQAINTALQTALARIADSTLADAKKAEAQVPDALRPITEPIAETTLRFAERNKQVINKIESAESVRIDAEASFDELKQRFEQMKSKVESVGLQASVGAMLRNERVNLPDVRRIREEIRKRSVLIDRVQLSNFAVDEERSSLVNVRDETQRLLQSLPGMNSENDERQVKNLLEARVNVLNELHKNQSTYLKKLADASIVEEKIALMADEYRDFIEQRVLWIKSNPSLFVLFSDALPLSESEIPFEMEQESGISWKSVFAPLRALTTWSSLLTALKGDLFRNKIVYLGATLFMLLLLILKPLIPRRLKQIADKARNSAYSYFAPSLRALLLNIVSALFWPFVLGFLGWRLTHLPTQSDLSQSLSNALWASSVILLPLSFFNSVFATNGLADAHFDWSQRTAVVLRQNIRWLTLIFMPLVFCSTLAISLELPTGNGLIHRSLFLVSSAVLLVFAWRTLHPQTGLPRNYLLANQGSWLERLHAVWFWGLLSVPVALALLTILGYTYTAQELAWRGYQTLSWGGLLWVLHGLFMRLLMIRRRKLSVEAARARYAQFQKQQAELAEARKANPTDSDKEQGSSGSGPDQDNSERTNQVQASVSGISITPDGIQVEDDPLADLRANTAQSRRLVTTLMIGVATIMLWMTWHNVLPALSFLERWPLWQSSREIAEQFTDDTGVKRIRHVETPDPVTVADVVFAVFVVGVGFVAARDFPGLMELAVLKRLPLESSVRYAITTLSSYALFGLGLFVSCRLIGLRWQQIQWMATALTFGLAFGLQEMFANFVAGIILLFERPMRVGDIVTIDDVSGIVSRVRMRATTVTNWDRKDYIVPNKDFITGRLLNWTLSDRVNRIVINVGVAYGSDTQRAKQILVQIAKDHRSIEDDPVPMATFEEFGASSLNLVLRCFIAISNMPIRLETIDQLHTQIDREFKAAGIEIAFPQQDIHIRDVPWSTDRPNVPPDTGTDPGVAKS